MEEIKKYENNINRLIYTALVLDIFMVAMDFQTGFGTDVLTVVITGGALLWILSGVKSKNLHSIKTFTNILFGFFAFWVGFCILGLIGLTSGLSGDISSVEIVVVILGTMGATFFLVAIYRLKKFLNNKLIGGSSGFTIGAEVSGFVTMYVFYVICMVAIKILEKEIGYAIVTMCYSYFELQVFKTLIYWIDTFTKSDTDGSKEGSKEESKESNLNISEKVEILKGYKEMLDNGIISQEEFDKKKEEIL